MRAGWIGGALVALGCASTGANVAAPKAASVHGASTPESPPSAPVEAAFPRTLAVVRPDSTFVLYLDGDKLHASPWFSGLVGATSSMGGLDPFGMVEKRCGFDPAAALKSLAVAGSVDDDGPTGLLAAAELTRPASDALSCIERFQPEVKKARVAGHEALVLDEDNALVGVDRLLALGAPRDLTGFDVERAPRSLPPFAARALAAHRNATLVAALDWSKRAMPLRTLLLVMESDQSHWSVRADIETAAPGLARQIAAQADLSKLPVKAELRSVLPTLHSSVRDQRVTLELRVDGDGAAQARGIGALAAVGIYGVRRYLAQAKEAEARNTVAQISKDLAAYYETLPPGKRLLPPSAPLTPATVPHGHKVQTKPDDWNHGTWKAIQFEMIDPQYYSYEIVTAKDRKSAVVRATGDLNGDDIESRFSIKLQVDEHGELMVAPYIEEYQPDE